MKKSRWLLIGSYAVLGVLLPVSAIALVSWDERPRQHLKDGSVVHLTSLQYGTAQPIRYGPTWKRRLSPLASSLPEGVAELVRCEALDPTGFKLPPSLILGLDREGGADPTPPQGELVDRHGCRFSPIFSSPGSANRNPTNLEAFVFFPRREPSFQFQIFLPKVSSPAPVPSFTVVNPTDTDYPVWKAEALPHTTSSVPLEVTLESIRTGYSAEAPQRAAQPGELALTRLDYRLPPRCGEWKPMGTTLTDAMGATSYLDVHDQVSAPNVLYVPGSNLCREEPAYRYEIEFSRHCTEGAQPDQVFDLGSRDLADWKNRTCSLSGGRQVKVELEVGKPSSYLRITSPAHEGERERLWIRDLSLDRMTVTHGIAGRAAGAQITWSVLPATRRISLRLGIYKTRTVGFTVKPRWIE